MAGQNKGNFRRFILRHQIKGMAIKFKKVFKSRAVREDREKRRFPIAIGQAEAKIQR